MYLIFLYLLSQSIKASEIEVHYKLTTYHIISDSKLIKYTASYTELSIKKQKCNEHIFNSLESKLKNFTTTNFQQKPSRNTYTITIDHNKLYDNYNSKRAHFFDKFDSYFKTLKIEEKLNCN